MKESSVEVFAHLVENEPVADAHALDVTLDVLDVFTIAKISAYFGVLSQGINKYETKSNVSNKNKKQANQT